MFGTIYSPTDGRVDQKKDFDSLVIIPPENIFSGKVDMKNKGTKIWL